MANELSPAKQRAIALLAAGMPVKDVADEIGVTRKCLHDWKTKDGAYASALSRAKLDACAAHTLEAREVVGGIWARLAHRFADFDDSWDDLSWEQRIKVCDMMLKHFKTPEDKTSYKETRSLAVKTTYPQPPEPIETTAEPVDDATTH